MPLLEVYARNKNDVSYLGQLIKGLERWQREWMRLWLSFSEWHYCLEEVA
jgi:hypothetical protein